MTARWEDPARSMRYMRYGYGTRVWGQRSDPQKWKLPWTENSKQNKAKQGKRKKEEPAHQATNSDGAIERDSSRPESLGKPHWKAPVSRIGFKQSVKSYKNIE